MPTSINTAAIVPALLAALALGGSWASPAEASNAAIEMVPSGQSGSRARTPRVPRRSAQPPAMAPEAVLAEAQAQATAAGTGCEVTQANLLGQTTEGSNLFEVTCSTGPGYLLAASTPPIVSDCVLLASSAATARAADPAADVGPQCSIPANLDTKGFIKGYAPLAGVTCAVDDGAVRGRSSDGGIVYEIGCAGTDGYHITNLNGTWTKNECLKVVSQNGTCSLTTPEEQAATVKSWLGATEASACNVERARLMGRNERGYFFEFTCAGADGYIARVDAEYSVQQLVACSTPQARVIGTGCTLATSSAAVPAEQ